MKLSRNSNSRRLDRCFFLYLILVLFYYSYRYILKYNSSGTSSTYSDTPLMFQLLKYVILIGILCVLLAKNTKIRYSANNKLIGLLLLIIIIQGLFAGLVTGSVNYIGFSLVLLPTLFFLSSKKNFVEGTEKVLLVFAVFTAIYELIQVVLFLKTGRLPALAYSTGVITDVRFGGSWDDPNGFSILLSFFIPYFIMKTKGITRIIALSFSLVILLLTWSVTGILSCFFGIFLAGVYLSHNRKIVKRILFCALALIGIALLLYIPNYASINGMIENFISSKQGSVSGHLAGWSLEGVGLLTFLGLKPIDRFSEVGILRLIYMGGIPALIVFFLIVADTLKNLKILMKYRKDYVAFGFGSVSFVLAFLISLLNLPNIFNFSCFGVFVAVIIVANSFNKKLCPEYDRNKRQVLLFKSQ